MVGIIPALRAAIREVCGTEHVVRGMAYLGGEEYTNRHFSLETIGPRKGPAGIEYRLERKSSSTRVRCKFEVIILEERKRTRHATTAVEILRPRLDIYSLVASHSTLRTPLNWRSAGATGVGSLLGATVGGLLAQPVDYYPSTFSSNGIFARCVVCAVLSAS